MASQADRKDLAKQTDTLSSAGQAERMGRPNTNP
jgi:hypothetical protein